MQIRLQYIVWIIEPAMLDSSRQKAVGPSLASLAGIKMNDDETTVCIEPQ